MRAKHAADSSHRIQPDAQQQVKSGTDDARHPSSQGQRTKKADVIKGHHPAYDIGTCAHIALHVHKQHVHREPVRNFDGSNQAHAQQHGQSAPV
jgi:hypothetical protein